MCCAASGIEKRCSTNEKGGRGAKFTPEQKRKTPIFGKRGKICGPGSGTSRGNGASTKTRKSEKGLLGRKIPPQSRGKRGTEAVEDRHKGRGLQVQNAREKRYLKGRRTRGGAHRGREGQTHNFELGRKGILGKGTSPHREKRKRLMQYTKGGRSKSK